jgi:hypothetical protein
MHHTKLLHGGCLCGGIRFQISTSLDFAENCHCSMCRKAHGAAFSTNAVFPTEALDITAGSALITEYESSPNRRKCFCSRCGSQLFIRRTNRPDITVVTLGSLDGDPGVRPARHVFVASKAPWHQINAELPQYQIYPGIDPEETFAPSHEGTPP